MRDNGTVLDPSDFFLAAFNRHVKYREGGLGNLGERGRLERETWQDLLIVGIVPADTPDGI
ncbi:hypothetical protein SH501x_001876 [Pirellulaceae bacterium SH501]